MRSKRFARVFIGSPLFRTARRQPKERLLTLIDMVSKRFTISAQVTRSRDRRDNDSWDDGVAAARSGSAALAARADPFSQRLETHGPADHIALCDVALHFGEQLQCFALLNALGSHQPAKRVGEAARRRDHRGVAAIFD